MCEIIGIKYILIIVDARRLTKHTHPCFCSEISIEPIFDEKTVRTLKMQNIPALGNVEDIEGVLSVDGDAPVTQTTYSAGSGFAEIEFSSFEGNYI